ncbi:unnamed protein product, partial [Rotaria sp. Silwood2]
IADGLCLVAAVGGTFIPTGEKLSNTAATLAGYWLKRHEYKRYQKRMSLITNAGTIVELTDIARQVAYKLAIRYKDQLEKLQRPEKGSEVCCFCCTPCRCNSENNSSNNKNYKNKKSPAQKVASFGVSAVVEIIIKEDNEKLVGSKDKSFECLVNAIIEIICDAQPTLTKNMLKIVDYNKKTILQLKPKENEEKPNAWPLYEFYRKPGIWYIDADGQMIGKCLPWMNPDQYGYREGTLEEYNSLVETRTKENDKSNKCDCCDCCC